MTGKELKSGVEKKAMTKEEAITKVMSQKLSPDPMENWGIAKKVEEVMAEDQQLLTKEEAIAEAVAKVSAEIERRARPFLVSTSRES